MISVRESDFPEIKDAWLTFESEGHIPTVFQTYDWINTWWKHLGFRGKKLILAAYEEGELIGIAPLYTSRMSIKGIPFMNVMRLIGAGESDYQAFILKKNKEEEALLAILEHLKGEKWDIFWLSDVHSESTTNLFITEALRKTAYYFNVMQHTPCPYIELPKSFEDYQKMISGGTRRNINYYFTKLRKIGNVVFVKIKETSVIDKGMMDFFRLHESRWQSVGKPGALNSQELKQFHKEVSLKLSRYLNLSFIELDGKRIACEYSYDFNDIRFNYLRGMDMEYRQYRLGNILVIKLIEDAINEGVREYDFMRGDEEYKYHFTKTQRHNMKYFFSKARLKLKTFAAIEKISGQKV